MFTCRFIIFCCSVFLSREINADFWCHEDHLESLIKCLLATNIKSPELTHGHIFVEEFARRYQCARDADCTLKPWDIRNSKIRILIQFVECMEDGNGSWRQEVYCRRELAAELQIFAHRLYRLYFDDLWPSRDDF